ncbi:MAG: hypothetical protein WCX65_13590 [bacterium]
MIFKINAKKRGAGIIAMALIVLGVILLDGSHSRAAESYFRNLKGGKIFYAATLYEGSYYLFEFAVGKPEPAALFIVDKNGGLKKKETNMKKMEEIGTRVFEKAGERWNMKAKADIKNCEIRRYTIDQQVEMYYMDKGEYPKDDLSDIGADNMYFPDGVPACPVDNSKYALDPETHRVAGHREGEGTHRYVSPELPDLRKLKTKTMAGLLAETGGMIVKADKGKLYGLPMSVTALGDDITLFAFNMQGALERRLDGAEAEKLLEKIAPDIAPQAQAARYAACRSELEALRSALKESAGAAVSFKGATAESICGLLYKKPGCGAVEIEARVGKFCGSAESGAWKYESGIELSDTTYKIHGAAKIKKACRICITQNGTVPEYLTECPEVLTCM